MPAITAMTAATALEILSKAGRSFMKHFGEASKGITKAQAEGRDLSPEEIKKVVDLRRASSARRQSAYERQKDRRGGS